MENEFIPYEQALALKELGFDEPCLAWYNIKGVLLSDITIGYESSDFLYQKEDMDNNQCIVPTFSQAFRWFREKYKLYHNIKMFGDWDKPQYSYIISGRTMINPAHMWYYKDVNSYPEAELACLKKLIEIIKAK